jgi:hypothetical protein
MVWRDELIRTMIQSGIAIKLIINGISWKEHI